MFAHWLMVRLCCCGPNAAPYMLWPIWTPCAAKTTLIFRWALNYVQFTFYIFYFPTDLIFTPFGKRTHSDLRSTPVLGLASETQPWPWPVNRWGWDFSDGHSYGTAVPWNWLKRKWKDVKSIDSFVELNRAQESARLSLLRTISVQFYAIFEHQQPNNICPEMSRSNASQVPLCEILRCTLIIVARWCSLIALVPALVPSSWWPLGPLLAQILLRHLHRLRGVPQLMGTVRAHEAGAVLPPKERATNQQHGDAEDDQKDLPRLHALLPGSRLKWIFCEWWSVMMYGDWSGRCWWLSVYRHEEPMQLG